MMENLPEGWELTNINEFIEQVKDKIEPNENSSLSYIGLEHLSKGGGIETPGNSDFLKSTKSVFQNGDVLYGKLRPYLNKHAFVDFEGVCSTDILVFRAQDVATAKLLNYYLGTNEVIGFANENSKGINLPRVSGGVMGNLPFPLPPLAEQKRIVDKLDMAFGYLENIRKRWQRIIDLRIRYVNSCLVNSNQSHYHKTEKLLSYLRESTTRIGKEWYGKPKVGVSAQKGIIDLDVGQKESFENYKIVQPGDFVYNAMRINIGSIAQYEGESVAITSPDYIVFRVKNHLSPKLLLGFLKSPNGLLEIGSNTKGSVRSRLYFKNLANINYPIAPLVVQDQAERVLTWYANTIKKWECSIEISLNRMHQELLAKAFRGELVPQDPADEPASILLRKIKEQNEKNISNRKKIVVPEHKSLPEMSDKKSLLELMQSKFNDNLFSFDEIKPLTNESYEELKEEIFRLLDDGQRLVTVFSHEDKLMKFKIISNETQKN